MPDFIIVGAMKCATSTLHEQLARQRGIFMTSPKEPCFFSDDEVWQRGVEWYASLFNQARPDDLCGESSTHYTKLPTYPLTIERMKAHLPSHIKFLYIMRHPIDRLISQHIHEWTQRVVSGPIDQAIDEFPELIDYSRYAMQLEPYFDAFGQASVLPMFFDRLSSHPQQELERVCQFIGRGGPARWDESIEEQNVSSQRMRQNPLRDAIVNFPGLKTIRRNLVPQAVRDRIKQLWMMKGRPQLSPANLKRLTNIFDEDLQILGRWLGLELSCASFKHVAPSVEPRWRTSLRAAVP